MRNPLRSHAEAAIADLPTLRNAAEKVAAHILHGGHAQRRAGGHEKFWQFREYQDSDRPQDIDWRQSAKTDHVYVREKEMHNPQTAVFWADRSQGMNFKSETVRFKKLEAAQILSLALAILFQRGDEQVGFLGSRPGRSEAALDKIEARLLERSNDALPQGKIPRDSTLIFCGDFLSSMEDIESCFQNFAAQTRKALIIQTLDPAELELPYSGHVVFEGTGQTQHKVDNVTAIRDAYRDRINNHVQALEILCQSQGWDYILHRTDAPLEESLLKIWEGLEQ